MLSRVSGKPLCWIAFRVAGRSNGHDWQSMSRVNYPVASPADVPHASVMRERIGPLCHQFEWKTYALRSGPSP